MGLNTRMAEKKRHNCPHPFTRVPKLLTSHSYLLPGYGRSLGGQVSSRCHLGAGRAGRECFELLSGEEAGAGQLGKLRSFLLEPSLFPPPLPQLGDPGLTLISPSLPPHPLPQVPSPSGLGTQLQHAGAHSPPPTWSDASRNYLRED